MADSSIKLRLRANTRFVMPVAWALSPAVLIGLISEDRAVAIAMKFARFHVAEWREGDSE